MSSAQGGQVAGNGTGDASGAVGNNVPAPDEANNGAAADAVSGTEPTKMETANSLMTSGRGTLFCCLGCGMPYSFPDEAYTSEDEDVRSLLLFVHRVRHEVRNMDQSKASTAQWQVRCPLFLFFPTLCRKSRYMVFTQNKQQPNKCHYIHKFLHANLIRNISTFDEAHWRRVAMYFKSSARRTRQERQDGDADDGNSNNMSWFTGGLQSWWNRNGKNGKKKGGNSAIPDVLMDPPETEAKRRKMWSKELVQAFNNLTFAVRFEPMNVASHAADASPKSTGPFVLDEKIMEYTSEWCNACNMEATNHAFTKNMLFGAGATDEDKSVFKPLLNVPMPKDLPMGMRVMHDTYVFIYVTCSIMAVFLRKLKSSRSQAQVKGKKTFFV